MELLGRRHRLTPAAEPTLKDILVLRPGADLYARLGPLAPPARRVTHPGRGAGRVPWAGEEPEETGTPARMFSWRDITSGLPDVCREEDERQQGRRLRVLLGRVKAARAVVATTHGLAETLAIHNALLTRWASYQVATEVLTHEVGPRVSPERSRAFERIAASALLLREHGTAPA